MFPKETEDRYLAADSAYEAAEEALKVTTARLLSDWEQSCLIADSRAVDYQNAIDKSSAARLKYIEAIWATRSFNGADDVEDMHDNAYNAAYEAIKKNDNPHADESDLAFRAAAKIYQELEK